MRTNNINVFLCLPGSNIQFQSNDSEFSWRKEKEVRKATESLTGRYDCYAHPHEDKSPDVKSFNIAVVPEERVVFEEETNMKDQIEVVKDDEPFSLKCLVRGSPQPTIRWLKRQHASSPNSQQHVAAHLCIRLEATMLDYDLEAH
ncbi:Roundabout 2 [Portunus trituberculatus]|uniref:Roundabout 2 n=1 Tax=Portunus trituberculatus TaxID=210409 RepID=A0A5B7HFE5_PORTR|nr:Roundabout 2 [Portunus trituberculatus]